MKAGGVKKIILRVFPPNMFFCFCLSDTPRKGGIGVWGGIAPLPHLLTD